MILLCLLACLERVTGEPVPLDARFFAAVEEAVGQPGVGSGSAAPFADHDGPMVTIRGRIVTPGEGAIDLDVRTPDAAAEGGVRGRGKLLLEEAGPFELQVPRGLGHMELQAFQDQGGDGPTADDPFGQVELEVGEEDADGLLLELVVGARSGGPVHTEAPPGAPGGSPNAPPAPGGEAPPGGPGPGGGSGAPGGDRPFASYEGPTVLVSGTLLCEGCVTVDLDLFQPDPTAPGGRRMLGKIKHAPGAFSFDAPRGFGPILFEAFSDKAGDGPSPEDPMGTFLGNPLEVGRSDANGVDIVLEVRQDGRMPMGAPPGPGDPNR